MSKARQIRRNPASLFGKPESVAEQKVRQTRELAARLAKERKEAMEDRGRKPLAGRRGDLGQGDLFGGGDLFSKTNPMKSRKTKAVRRRPVKKRKNKAGKLTRSKVVKTVETVRTNPRKRVKRRRIHHRRRSVAKVKRAVRIVRRRPMAKRRRTVRRRARKTGSANYVAVNAGSKVMLCRLQGSKLQRMGSYTRAGLKKFCAKHGIKTR